ncbi:hypothetical protein Y032_0194g1458 [Ancylostoma ceylanicum]|uniref:Endonuclease/exonuclease/phosphatase domain-containing protein n=1 Tax=Ancylostoma ceylanicum TaxID=53326 RepID=A0A016SPC5_9BILA|nr:hypothetical protein Y032_0194g1458 [Ancylostoma ceylanicum]
MPSLARNATAIGDPDLMALPQGMKMENDCWTSCRHAGFFHGNSMFEKPAERRWTWESSNGRTPSEIDHILINRRSSLFDVSVLPSFDTDSQHRPFRAKISLNKKNFKRDTHGPAPHKFPTFKSADLESAVVSLPPAPLVCK